MMLDLSTRKGWEWVRDLLVEADDACVKSDEIVRFVREMSDLLSVDTDRAEVARIVRKIAQFHGRAASVTEAFLLEKGLVQPEPRYEEYESKVLIRVEVQQGKVAPAPSLVGRWIKDAMRGNDPPPELNVRVIRTSTERKL